MQVALNQLVLGPIVIAIVFAWNSAWQGRLSYLPDMYQKKALPTLVDGTTTGSLSFLSEPILCILCENLSW